MSDCLDNVIKLSRTTCDCFPVGSPAVDINAGQTEVYLDELDGLNLNLIDSVSDCEQGSLWDMMMKARLNATNAFKADLLSTIEGDYIAKRPNYSGLLGQSGFNQTLNVSGYAGNVLSCHRVVGGKIIVNRIGLIMNATAAVTVNVYDNDEHQTTPIATYVINSAANAVAYGTLNTPLELPMWSRNLGLYRLEYFFVYQINGFLPKNNAVQCIPCSGGRNKDVIWNHWLNVYGFTSGSSDITTYNRQNNLMGMVLDAAINCEGGRVICSDEYPLDFNSGKAQQIAYAIRFKAGAILIDSILSSPAINRFTMMDREALYGKRNYYRSKYEEWIVYLAQNVPIINNDCWVCRQPHLIKRGTILS